MDVAPWCYISGWDGIGMGISYAKTTMSAWGTSRSPLDVAASNGHWSTLYPDFLHMSHTIWLLSCIPPKPYLNSQMIHFSILNEFL